MCTVTWLRQPGGYVLFSNRDERNTRLQASGPRLNELRGVKYLAPVDGDHGGTWIGVNQFGLSLCLLNRYSEIETHSDREYISRGLLLLEMLDCSIPAEFIRRLAEFDFNRFRPFSLLMLSRDLPAQLLKWTGSELSVTANAEKELPLTSTSLAEPKIATERKAQFHSLISRDGLTPLTLDHFHRSHLPARGPFSVCMHRDRATTVSLSKVTVGHNDIEFVYEPGSPCERNQPETVRL